MRQAAALLLLALFAVPGFAQRRDGSFQPASGQPVPWRLNEHHTLEWAGTPYIPLGARIDGNPASIKRIAAAGIRDVMVDLPASGGNWKATVTALESAGMRYVIRISSLAPSAKGISIEPQAYRVSGITTTQTVNVRLPETSRAFIVVASRRDGTMNQTGWVPVVNGTLSVLVKTSGSLEQVLLIYPERTSSEQVDFWERLDARRDELLATLRSAGFGPGLRGIVNPLGQSVSLPGRDLRFIPTSPAFRQEFREQLETKYRTMGAAFDAWDLGANAYESFDDLARLVPLWQGTRGVASFLDTGNGRTHGGDRASRIWSDIAEAVATASMRRYERLVAAIRSVADVPVVQEWSGWSSAYEVSTPSLDGIAARINGSTPSAVAESGGRAASSVMRWATSGWLLASDVDLGDEADAISRTGAVIDDLTALGMRGMYFRTDSDPQLAALVAEVKARTDLSSLATSSPRPIFFPENATNPARIQRLPGGAWWLPAPSDGDRVDLGTGFFAYRMRQRGVGEAVAIWARVPGRYRLRMVASPNLAFQTLDGSDPMPKNVKNGIEVNLTEAPLLVVGIDQLPIPEPALNEAMSLYGALIGLAERQRRDVFEERTNFQNLVPAFDKNPGGTFPIMRKTLARLQAKIASFLWIEAERPSNHIFSEELLAGGCSGGQALSLRTPLDAPSGGYFADYRISARSKDEQEVWIAARIPADQRGRVFVKLGGQTLALSGEPQGTYGDGYGWYRLGTTRLAPNIDTLRLEIRGSGPADLGIDVILLTPLPFQPNGVNPPTLPGVSTGLPG